MSIRLGSTQTIKSEQVKDEFVVIWKHSNLDVHCKIISACKVPLIAWAGALLGERALVFMLGFFIVGSLGNKIFFSLLIKIIYILSRNQNEVSAA